MIFDFTEFDFCHFDFEVRGVIMVFRPNSDDCWSIVGGIVKLAVRAHSVHS